MAKNSRDAYGAEGESKVLFIDPDKIKIIEDDKHHLYDERVKLPVNEELVASIMLKGIVEPAIVSKDHETGQILCVDGRQRIRACREANKRLKKDERKLVPCLVERGTARELVKSMVMANLGRADLTASQRARYAQRLLAIGVPESELHVVLHCSSAAAKNYLALLDCTSVVQKAVESGQLPATQAYKLSKLDGPEQKKLVGKLLKAASGVKGKHKRAAKMRAVRRRNGDIQLRPKLEVLTLREQLDSRDDQEARNWLSCLDWMLGKSDSTPKVDGDEDEGEDNNEQEKSE